MKKILSAVLAVMLLAAVCTGCGKNSDRVLYNEKLTKYVTLGEYKNIAVDTKSDDFKKEYDDVIASDVSSNKLYVKKTEGTVAKGDTANIDYEGKKDGVAFDGGTAAGYDLEIGSGSFIDGFEDGLIGKEIGSTVDLNLTFPENYGSADLAGKAVVFTVTIHYVLTDEQRKPEDYYAELDFKSLSDYTDDVTERAVKNHLLNTVTEQAKVKDYPEKDIETIYSAYRNMLETNIKNQYGIGLADYLSYNNQTEDDFKKSIIDEQIKSVMEEQMVLYAILDKEKIKVTDEDITEQLGETVKSYNSADVTADKLNDFYGEYYFEYMAVSEKAMDFIYQNAKIS